MRLVKGLYEVSNRLCVSGLLLYQGCQVTSMVSLKPLMQWSSRLRAYRHVGPLLAPVLVFLRAVNINSLPCAFLETASQGGGELVTQINVDWLVFVIRLKWKHMTVINAFKQSFKMGKQFPSKNRELNQFNWLFLENILQRLVKTTWT